MKTNLQSRIQRLELAALSDGDVELEDLVRGDDPPEVTKLSPRAAKLCGLILATPDSGAVRLRSPAQ